MLSVHVMHPIKSPELLIERRTLSLQSSALSIGLLRVIYSYLINISFLIQTLKFCRDEELEHMDAALEYEPYEVYKYFHGINRKLKNLHVST